MDYPKFIRLIVQQGLFCPMQKYGVSGNELAWFTSYLQDRRQLCKVNGVSSRIEEIHCGVPQDFVLDPFFL